MHKFLKLLFIICYLVWPSISHSGATPATGDWTVNDFTTVENQTILLNGNLIVQSGGSLTLNNVTLKIASTYDGQYGIDVNTDGSLFINNSKIMSGEEIHSYNFAVNGSSFEMLNSELHHCGWGPDSENFGDEAKILSGKRGLVVTTTEAIIQGNTISENYIGVILAGSEIILNNNNIHSNNIHGIYGYKNSGCDITNNTIQHATISSPIRIRNARNNNISNNNLMSSIHRGVIDIFHSSGNSINANQISGLGVGISLIFVSNDNTINNNSISTDECGMMIWGWNNSVEGNTIANDSVGIFTGIYLVYAYNSRIIGNMISTVTEEHGIWLRNSSNNKIASNIISARVEQEASHTSGILLINSSKNNIIGGNNVSSFSRGISLFFESGGNTIIGNEFSANKLANILIYNSSANTIYNNNFMGNEQLPYDNGNNSWDFSGDGNYWSDYSGPDVNSDGIGEDPYTVPPEGDDKFPKKSPILINAIQTIEPDSASPPMPNEVFSRIVTAEELIENQTINLSYIDVIDGAKLLLKNVEFITGSTEEVSGLTVYGNAELIVDNCRFTHVDNGYGFTITAMPGSKLTIKESEINGVGHDWWYGGIHIYSATALLENNLISNSPVRFFNCSIGSVTGNTFNENYYAIGLESSDNFQILNNFISGSVREAITLGPSNNTSVKGNSISNIWKDGILAYRSSNNIFDRNIIVGKRSNFGAIVIDGDNIRALNNVVSKFSTGIRLSGKNHELSGNTISENITGIDCHVTQNCSIYHNNIIENKSQANGGDCNYYWDNGPYLGGNYWSDHDCKGDPSSGSQPYYINSNIIDRFPFRNANGWINGNSDNSGNSGGGSSGGGGCFTESLRYQY